MNKTTHKKADELMTKYVALLQQRKDLLDTVMEDVKLLEASAKITEEALIEIGTLNKDSFNEEGNYELTSGYLHIAQNAKVVLAKKFDLKAFHQAHPEWIEVDLKLAPIKKAFLDAQMRKELKAHGVSVDTNAVVQVKPQKLK